MPPTNKITCREFIDFLACYLDDDLPAERKRLFDRHMAVCAHCVAYVDSYRTTIAAIRHTVSAADAVPDDAPEELITAILAARRKQ